LFSFDRSGEQRDVTNPWLGRTKCYVWPHVQWLVSFDIWKKRPTILAC